MTATAARRREHRTPAIAASRRLRGAPLHPETVHVPAPQFDAEMAAIYDENGPKRLVPGYAVFQQLTPLLLDAELADDAHVLVMAAGGGAELKAIGAARASWRLTGVDPSPAMLDLARSKLTPAEAERTTLVQGYVADAPKGPFDAATSCLVMAFLPDDGAKLDYIQQIRRRLRPGGPALFVEMAPPPTPQGWARFLQLYDLYARRMGADESLIARATAAQQHLHHAPAERQAALLEEAGFKNVETFFKALFIQGWIARA
jgi:tRNA (cmo5U34)-methyltransferase